MCSAWRLLCWIQLAASATALLAGLWGRQRLGLELPGGMQALSESTAPS